MNGQSSRTEESDKRSVIHSDIPSALIPARERFCDLLIERIIAFESFRLDFRKGRNPEAALKGVTSLAHMIAGVAETLGYPKAGNLAAAIEHQCRDGLGRLIPAAEIWHGVEPRLSALMNELELLLDE